MATEITNHVLVKVLGKMITIDVDMCTTSKYFPLVRAVIETPWIRRLRFGHLKLEKSVPSDELPNPTQIVPVLLKLQQMLKDLDSEDLIELFANTETPEPFYAGVKANVITCKEMLFHPSCDMGLTKAYHIYPLTAIEMSLLPQPTGEWRVIQDQSYEVRVWRGDGDETSPRREVIGLKGQLQFKIGGKPVSKEEYYAAAPSNKRPREEAEDEPVKMFREDQ